MKDDYEKAKSECWETFNRLGGGEEIGKKATFDFAYNAAFNLGKAHSKRMIGEEMLQCSKKKLQDIYAYNDEVLKSDPTHIGAILLKNKLFELFGLACYKDGVSESIGGTSIKVGDKVKIVGASKEEENAHIGNVGEVLDIDVKNDRYFVIYSKGQAWVRSCDLEPCTQAIKDEVPYFPDPAFYPHLPLGIGVGKRSPKQINDGDKNMLRLKIAAQIATGLLASPVDVNMQSKDIEYITEEAFRYANALIAESEKY